VGDQVLETGGVFAQSNSSVIITEKADRQELCLGHSFNLWKYFPLISVHCSALTESFEANCSDTKGAYRSYVNRKGRFEMADGGTIFLDEIATISSKMQVELLRVLETKRFVRVGGNKEIASDFRVICATNRDLKSMVKSGTFREDLYYRLNVVNIAIPPLRERTEDIPLLVNHFIEKYCISMSRDMITIEPAALKHLENFEFPGNVRELENMIERAIVVGNGKEIKLRDLPWAKKPSTALLRVLMNLKEARRNDPK
jgi:transcriptional regulator with PAS, ATPase and Fis domain